MIAALSIALFEILDGIEAGDVVLDVPGESPG